MVGTGLYVAALVLTWVMLFSIERFARTDIRDWAPYFQGTITAAAIISTWMLHDAKRRSDLRDAQAAVKAAYAAITCSLEDWCAFLESKVASRKFTVQLASRNVTHFKEEVENLRKLSIEKLSDPILVRRAHMMTVALRQFNTALEEVDAEVKAGRVPS